MVLVLIAVAVAALAAVLVGPSAVLHAALKRTRARPGSLVARAATLAFHRLVVVVVVVAAHLPLLVLGALRPDAAGPPEPNHEFNAAFETWRGEMQSAALFTILLELGAGLALFVVLVRELVLLWQTLRARRRVLRGARAAEAPADAPFEIDFGVGEGTWAFFRAGAPEPREAYREMPRVDGWARGSPMTWPACVGPFVTMAAAITLLACGGFDMMLTLD